MQRKRARRAEESTCMAQRGRGRPSQAAARILFPVLPPPCLSSSLQHISFPHNPATAISPVGPHTSQLFSGPNDKAEEDCLKMTNRISLVLCRAAAGSQHCYLQGTRLAKSKHLPMAHGGFALTNMSCDTEGR